MSGAARLVKAGMTRSVSPTRPVRTACETSGARRNHAHAVAPSSHVGKRRNSGARMKRAP